MENQRFDELTKSFGLGSTRRSALKGVVGGVLGLVGLGVVAGAASAGPGGTCPNGKDSSCADGCFCSPARLCFRCPEGSKQTLAGGCRCQHRAKRCTREFGGKVVAPVACG